MVKRQSKRGETDLVRDVLRGDTRYTWEKHLEDGIARQEDKRMTLEDVVSEDMEVVGAAEEEADDQKRSRQVVSGA